MTHFFLAFAVVGVASIFQGTFGVGMKYVRPLAWEAWWLIYSTLAMVVLPAICATLFVPGLPAVLQQTPPEVLGKAMLYGFFWGIGGILFGKSVTRLGVALTYGIVMGLAASAGSLLPLLGQQGVSATAIHWIVAGNLLMLLGVGLSAAAGVRRDRLLSGTSSSAGDIKTGLLMAVICGLLSALLNVGFSAALPVADTATAHGAIPRNASLASWVVVLFGAYLMNAAYSVILLFKNSTWSSFVMRGAWDGWKWALTTGVLWYAALAVYGQGSALMGRLGPVVGWPMLLGLALVLSNLLAVRAGEWKGAGQALRWMMGALAILVLACCCLGYSNKVMQG